MDNVILFDLGVRFIIYFAFQYVLLLICALQPVEIVEIFANCGLPHS